MNSCSASACIASKILIRRIAKILIRRIARPGSLKTPARFCQEFHCPSYLIDRCFAVCLAEDTFCSFGPLKKHVMVSMNFRADHGQNPTPRNLTLGTPVVPFFPLCVGVSVLKLNIRKKGTLVILGYWYFFQPLAPTPSPLN